MKNTKDEAVDASIVNLTVSKDGEGQSFLHGNDIKTGKARLCARGPTCGQEKLIGKNDNVNPKTVIVTLNNTTVKRNTEGRFFVRMYIFRFKTQEKADDFYAKISSQNDDDEEEEEEEE